MDTLILGVGNLLMADDGIGVRVVELLKERYLFPEEVTVLDGGTLGLGLLPQVQEAARLIIVDAVESGALAGTLVRYRGEEIFTVPGNRLSPHQVGLQDLLGTASALGSAPETVLLGVQPGKVTVSLELSPPVEAQLDTLVDQVIEELQSWGIAIELKH